MSSILSRVFFNFAGNWSHGWRGGAAIGGLPMTTAGCKDAGMQRRKQDAGNMLAAKIKRDKKQGSINTG